MPSIETFNPLITRWQNKQAVLNAWISLNSPFNVEIAAHAGFDAVTIDLQHGLVDIRDVPNLLAAVPQGTAAVVRVPWLDPGDVMRVLDMGAAGIICPMINTPQQAAEFASYGLYPPHGVRSNGPIRASLLGGPQYGQQADQLHTRFAMIETREAVACAEAILTTPGIDAFYIGPSDLARSYGYPATLDHEGGELYQVIEHLLQLAKRLDRRAGIHCGKPDYAAKMIALGFDFVTGWNDAVVLKAQADAVVSSIAGKQAGPVGAY